MVVSALTEPGAIDGEDRGSDGEGVKSQVRQKLTMGGQWELKGEAGNCRGCHKGEGVVGLFK